MSPAAQRALNAIDDAPETDREIIARLRADNAKSSDVIVGLTRLLAKKQDEIDELHSQLDAWQTGLAYQRPAGR